MLAAHPAVCVTVGFLSAARPRLACAVASARIRNPSARLALSTYLLAPGFFFGLTARVGADLVSEPLLVPDEPPSLGLVGLMIDRYADADRCARRVDARVA